MRSLVLLLSVLVLAGCASNDAPADDAPATTTPAPDAASEGATLAPVALAISLVERPAVGVPPTTMALDPAHLEAPAGARVVLTVTNDGQGPHNLVIDGLDVATDTLAPGDSVEVEFVAGEAGEYAMYCAVGGDGPMGHRAQGMAGTFVVA